MEEGFQKSWIRAQPQIRERIERGQEKEKRHGEKRRSTQKELATTLKKRATPLYQALPVSASLLLSTTPCPGLWRREQKDLEPQQNVPPLAPSLPGLFGMLFTLLKSSCSDPCPTSSAPPGLSLHVTNPLVCNHLLISVSAGHAGLGET